MTDAASRRDRLDEALLKARVICKKLSHLKPDNFFADSYSEQSFRGRNSKTNESKPSNISPGISGCDAPITEPSSKEHAKLHAEDIIVPPQICSSIQAHRGDFLRFIENSTGVRLNIDPNPVNNEGFKRIALSGSEESVSEAKGLIEQEMNTKQHEIYLVPANKIGCLIGKGGETIKGLQDRCNCRMFLTPEANEMTNVADKPINLIGTPESILLAKSLINEVVFLTKPGDFVTILQVPDHTASMIVGKKAENIRFLQQTSNTNIFLDNAVGNPLRKVYVSGSHEGAAYAFKLLVEQLGNCVTNLTEQENTQKVYGAYPEAYASIPTVPFTNSVPEEQYVESTSGHANVPVNYAEQPASFNADQNSHDQFNSDATAYSQYYQTNAAQASTGADYISSMNAYYLYYGSLAAQNPEYAAYYQNLQQNIQAQLSIYMQQQTQTQENTPYVPATQTQIPENAPESSAHEFNA